MGFFSGIMGNTSEISEDKILKDYSQILCNNENVEKAYKVIRDLMIFTDKRLIIIDKQGVTGNKTEYHSIPYNKITHFCIETQGHFDLDAELKIWISGMNEPIIRQFNKNLSVYDIQKILAEYVL